MTLQNLIQFRNKYYAPSDMIIGVVGNVSEEEVFDVISRWTWDRPSVSTAHPAHARNVGFSEVEHSSEQSIILYLYEGLDEEQSRGLRMADRVLNNGLGFGMHSLLFERIREQLGLCYSVGSYRDNYIGSSLFGLYGFLSAKNIEKVKAEMKAVLIELMDKGFDSDHLETARINTLFNLELDFQKTSSLGRFFVDQYYISGVRSPDEVREMLGTVMNDQIKEAAEIIFAGEPKYVQMVTKGSNDEAKEG